jgi:ABC-type transport system substrate-binding protein
MRGWVAPFVAAALVVLSCTATAPPTGKPSGTAAATEPRPSVVPNHAGVFAFAASGEPSFFSPSARDESTRRINSFLYRALYRLDDHLVPVPDLAEKGPRSGRTGWHVALRSGLQFSDGTPLTAADVTFTYRLALSANCPFPRDICSVVQQHVTGMVTVNGGTAGFQLRSRSQQLISLAMSRLGILPERAVLASLERLRAATKALKVADLQETTDQIAGATNAPECVAETPPPTCDIGSYSTQLEAILHGAQVMLPEHARFRLPSGGLDVDAYASALLDLVQGLVAALTTRKADAIAAAFPLLDFQRRPVGSGPYALGAYRAGESVVLVRKTPDPAGNAPREVRALIITDPSAAATALKTGDVDWLPEVSPDEVPSLEDDPAVRVAGRPGDLYRAIVFNVRPGRVYADPAARGAFARCLDKQALVADATSGRATVAWSPTSPASWAYRRSDQLPAVSRDAAEALLERAGWRKGGDGIYARRGQRLTSQIYVRPSRADQLAFAQAASQQLARCGIDLRVSELGFSGDILLRQVGWPNDFDTYLAENPIGLDPAADFGIFQSSRITSQANPGDANFGGWSSAQADKLIKDAAANLRTSQRRTLYGQLQDLLARDLPLYPLWYETSYAGVSRRVAREGGPIDPAAPYYSWDADRWILNSP